ncbi:MAG TPA: hypothetical protein VMJ66_05405 [Geobacteraceae bacterium]|nr:hypothetical protein [Geobacteraceae bacterium]
MATFTSGTLCQLPAEAATKPPAGRTADREKRLDRVIRFLQRTIDDLRDEQRLAGEDHAALEKQADAVTSFESPQLEADFHGLADWYSGYLDWLKDRLEELDDDLEQLSPSTFPGGEYWDNRFAEMINSQKELAADLHDRVGLIAAEKKRLAGILGQRRLLEERLHELEERRNRIEKRGSEQKQPLQEKERDTLDRVKADFNAVQAELLSLPRVDEDIFRYYALMTERGRGEEEWLSLRIEEYEGLREVAVVLPLDTYRGAAAMEAACRRIVRMYEGLTGRLNRKIDELDRQWPAKPAGTIRELDHFRDMDDLRDTLRWRFADQIGRYKIRSGAYNAELAEIHSGKP